MHRVKKSSFAESNLIPKHHYSSHYSTDSESGSLIRLWTTSFESKQDMCKGFEEFQKPLKDMACCKLILQQDQRVSCKLKVVLHFTQYYK